MRPRLDKLRRRARSAADRASTATGVPAGQDGAASTRASARDRGTMRRRIRSLRHRRDALLLELGALVMEMHRQGRGDSELISRRADEVSRVDTEARELARALDSGETLDDMIAAGILGTCTQCGNLLSTGTRFCSDCGTPAGSAPPAGNTDAETNGAPDTPAAVAGER